MAKILQGKVKWLVLAVILVAAAVGGYMYYNSQQEAAKANINADLVETQRQSLKSVVSATGTIRPVDSVEVSSKITARIKSVLVKENDTVKAGQTVAILDGKDYEATKDQATYKVNNTRSKYNRAEYLYSIGAKSKEELEDAEYDYDTAESSLSKTESDLAETVITAPMDGVVVGEPKSAGTMAVQGNSNPTVIMTIADMSRKQIIAKVDETDIGKPFTATVSRMSQTDVTNSWNINTSSTSTSTPTVIYYYVILDVDDPDNLLLPAMTARVDIVTDEKENALVVPISALKTDSSGSYVMVSAGKEQEKRYVSTGIYSDEYVEITDGLTDGEQLVVTYKSKSGSSKNMGGPPPM